MSETKIFTVEIEVHEDPDHTEAKALLDIDGDIRAGVGHAAIPPTPTAPASARTWPSPGR